jgi:hypothetical protein
MTVGRPVVFVWASVTLGFLVLTLSVLRSFRAGSSNGSLYDTLPLGDLFLLPALLSFRDRSSRRIEIESDVGEERRRGCGFAWRNHSCT